MLDGDVVLTTEYLPRISKPLLECLTRGKAVEYPSEKKRREGLNPLNLHPFLYQETKELLKLSVDVSKMKL